MGFFWINPSVGNFENFEKNFGQKITKSREKYFEIHCFRTRNFINISNFLNLEILELFRDLKSSKCL
jgi:L-ribulose-5-phosphate 3-epimerase UlaE